MKSHRVLFLVRRFHTNMIPMVDALQQHGHSVAIICATREVIEDYTLLQPEVINPNDIDHLKAENIIRRLKPTIVVIRELALGFKLIVQQGVNKKAKVVLYNQAPYFRQSGFTFFKKDVQSLYRRWKQGYPLKTITPVRGFQGNTPKLLTKFFRFPMSTSDNIAHRQYFANNQISIICVGKLAVPRKRHIWLLEALEELHIPCKLILTGAGNDVHVDPAKRSLTYYQNLMEKCSNMPSMIEVQVFEEISYAQMFCLYQQSDIFVLPSKSEPIAISPLEAMASGCAVLVPNTNGSSAYVTDGLDGLLFLETSYQDFMTHLAILLNSRQLVTQLGLAAQRTIAKQHNYSNFVKKFFEII